MASPTGGARQCARVYVAHLRDLEGPSVASFHMEGATLAVAFELLAPLVSDCARAPSLSGIGCAPMYIVKTNFGLSALAACRARGRIAEGIPHDDVVLSGLARC